MMKKHILVLMLLGITWVSFAQSTNDSILVKIDSLIADAVEQEEYEMASKLKKEKQYRLEIAEAVNNDDYEKAKEFKDKISALYGDVQSEQKPELKSEPSIEPQSEPVVETPAEEPTAPTETYDYGANTSAGNTPDSEYNYDEHLRSGFALGLSPGVAFASENGNSSDVFGCLGIRAGETIFFNRDFNKFRGGILVQAIMTLYMDDLPSDFNDFPDIFELLSVEWNVGPYFTYGFAKKQAVEFGVPVGFAIAEGGFDMGMAVFAFNPTIMYRVTKLGVGIEYARLIGKEHSKYSDFYYEEPTQRTLSRFTLNINVRF